MSKLSGAYHEMDQMNSMAQKDKWLNHIHPLAKLIVTVLYIYFVVSISKYNIAGILLMGIYPVILFILGEIPFRDCLKRLRVVLPLVCFVGILNPFFDRKLVFLWGSIEVTSGMISMVTLMLKGIFTVLAVYLLIASTTIEKICFALRMVHIPSVLVTQVLLTYRYISVLLKEAHTITEAYSLRAPGQKGVYFKVWGPLVGQLLLRSIDRADSVYAAMVMRGYQGEYYLGSQEKCRKKDYLYLLSWIVLFILIQLFIK